MNDGSLISGLQRCFKIHHPVLPFRASNHATKKDDDANDENVDDDDDESDDDEDEEEKNYSLFVWPYTQNYRSTVLSLHFPFLCYISKISIIVSLLLNTFLNGHVFDDHGFGDCSAYICVHLTEEQSKKNTRCQCALHLQVCLLPEKSVNII